MSTTSPAAVPASLVNQIEARQAELGVTDQQLCDALGYEKAVVLTLIKRGNIKMPLNKIPALAAALELDPAELLRAAIRESDPALGQIIEEVFNPLRLTATEVNLIKNLRELSGDTAVAPIVFSKSVIALVAA